MDGRNVWGSLGTLVTTKAVRILLVLEIWKMVVMVAVVRNRKQPQIRRWEP